MQLESQLNHTNLGAHASAFLDAAARTYVAASGVGDRIHKAFFCGTVFIAVLGLALSAQTVESLARTYRQSGSTGRSALLQYAAAHSKDQSGAVARFALGMIAFEHKDYPLAIENLSLAQPRLSKLADYIAYYLAAAMTELHNFEGAKHQLAAFDLPTPSPLALKAVLLKARVMTGLNSPISAVQILREHYLQLPQPAADLALASSYEAANDPAQAVRFYQRVYYEYPSSDAAREASAALDRLRQAMGPNFPPPMPEQMLDRANKLLDLRMYRQAREDFESLVARLGGDERDVARVGIGAVDYSRGEISSAYRYLRALQVSSPEADAERLYYLSQCARHLNADEEMFEFVQRLDRYPKSPWRLRALIAAGNRFLVSNQPEKYEPLFRACFESFSDSREAAYCHWKVTWIAYLRRSDNAQEMLKEHLAKYPGAATAAAALYFLGRSTESDGALPSAKAFYQKLAERFSNYYYGLLARERLAQSKFANIESSESVLVYLAGIAFPPVDSPEEQQSASQTKLHIDRARLLASAGLSDWAETELRFGAKNGGQAHLLAMELARISEDPSEALHKMKALVPNYSMLPFEAAPQRFWEYLFPLPYRSALVTAAARRNLDPFIVAGLIRQESEFNPKAISHANAYGLTQILPSTGRRLARPAGLRRFSTKMLLQPSPNLTLGAYYLRSILDHWGGKWEQTLAAYNAGPNRASDWSTWADYREPAEFVETIPFTETRDYVQAVLRNAAIYRHLYGDRPLEAQLKAAHTPARKKSLRSKARWGGRPRPRATAWSRRQSSAGN